MQVSLKPRTGRDVNNRMQAQRSLRIGECSSNQSPARGEIIDIFKKK